MREKDLKLAQNSNGGVVKLAIEGRMREISHKVFSQIRVSVPRRFRVKSCLKEAQNRGFPNGSNDPETDPNH